MTGVGRILAPQTEGLGPITDNILVDQARSAVRAPVLLPEHQHFVNTLDSCGGALDQYSSDMSQLIQKVHNDTLNANSLAPEEPMRIVQKATPARNARHNGSSSAKPTPEAPASQLPPKAAVQQGYKENPGALLGQLLSMKEPAPFMPPSSSAPAPTFEKKAAEVLSALATPTPAPTSQAARTPSPQAVPVLQQNPVQPSEITDTIAPDAAPQSRFVFRRRADGKLAGMTTPEGDAYDFERDSQGRIEAINMRKRS